ncbi:minor capsid protein [Kitasatospora sp. NPDC056181]|uniref:minor capsid protein n=1 Tax=Kitasatospora sp. NPDC056181 TaxID=3345737 RepID=UPI0035E1ABD4
MADLLDGLARLLDQNGLVQYEPTGAGGDLFLEAMPPSPDVCTVLTLYGGPEPDARLPYDEVRLQVRARGTQDPRVSRARAQAVYDLLHGARRLTLPDGTYLVLAVALQPVTSLGLDEQRRHEHVVNLRLDVEAPTINRPAE